MEKPIQRVTLFKISNEEHIDQLLAIYATLQQDAKKDSQPYILSCRASRIIPDARNAGFTVCARTTFASAADHAYYDTACAAHDALKASAKAWLDGPPVTVFMEE